MRTLRNSMVIVVGLSLGMSISSQAQTETFDFGILSGGGQAALDLDGEQTASTTSGSLVLTASAGGDTFHLNLEKGFGIEDGVKTAKPYEFNAGEVMSLTFNLDVLFGAIALASFNGKDSAFLDVPGQATITIDTPAVTLPAGLLLPAGQVATFGSVSGNGFSLAEMVVTAIPEPSSLALLAICSGGLLLLRRRRG